jgi:hypothetical protein
MPATLNIPVAARVISFIQPTPVGIVPVAIIYQPGNVNSEAEAADMERALYSGVKLGRANLRIRKVSVTSLGQLSGSKAAFVTAGLRNYQDEVSEASVAQSILTITADENCVAQGRCIVGISSGTRAQITVNKAAAKRSGVHFGSAFLMLVKEI